MTTQNHADRTTDASPASAGGESGNRRRKRTSKYRRSTTETVEVTDPATGNTRRTTTSTTTTRIRRVVEVSVGTASHAEQVSLADSGRGDQDELQDIRTVKLSIRGAASKDGSPSGINGDYYLDVVHCDERCALWELTFKPVGSLFRAQVLGRPRENGAIDLRVTVSGIDTSILWSGRIKRWNRSVKLARETETPVVAGVTWPESVEVTPLECEIPRSQVGLQLREMNSGGVMGSA